MRKFLVLCVVLILTLISPIYAFADDPEEYDPSGDRLATEEEMQQLDDELHSTSIAFYNLLSDNGTKATTHDVNDIYNWLNSYFGAGFGSYTTSYPTLAYARLGLIRSELSTMNLNINSLITNSNSIVDYLSSLNPDYDTTGISIYDVLHGVLTSLTSIDPNDGDLTIIEALVYITSALDDLHSDLSLIYSSSIGIENKLVSMQSLIMNFRSDVSSYLDTINTSINTGFTNVNANMALIINRLQSMQDDYNNITWLVSNITYNGVTNDISDSNNIVYLTPGTYPAGDYYFSFSNYGNYDSIFRVALPIQPRYPSYLTDYIDNISFVSSRDTLYLNNYYIDSNVDNYYTYIYIFNSPYILSSSTVNYLKIHFNNPFSLTNRTPLFNYILSSSTDYYVVSNRIYDLKYHRILSKFESLYASNDLIAAKEDQQSYENQAIEDFTGSGSAAATGQDLGDMKSISSAIKSGLQSGGSVNNALAPFNTNSGFWGWFSQSNYDNINNIPSSGLRSGHNNEPDIIDFYTNNQYTLQGLLSGGGN